MSALAGLRAVVTGGAGGLGRRIARALDAAGADVCLTWAREGTRARDLAADLARGHAMRLDLADPASVADGIAAAQGAMGGIDLLVNNAGVATDGHDLPPGDLEALTPEIWDRLMAVNLRGPYLAARAAAPALRASARGQIVNIGSTIGAGTWYADRAFAPSKAAVEPLTRYLAAALAPQVAVNCIAPGLMTDTGLGAGAPAALVAAWEGAALLGRTTAEDDVAALVVALAATRSVSGQTLRVDGGINLG